MWSKNNYFNQRINANSQKYILWKAYKTIDDIGWKLKGSHFNCQAKKIISIL
jgi:hypothetical protein